MISKATRQLVWDRAGDCCEKCGVGLAREYDAGEVHHRKYRSRGGPDTVDNLVLLCQPCHTKTHRLNLPGFAVSRYANQQLIPIPHWSGRELFCLPDGTYGREVWRAS